MAQRDVAINLLTKLQDKGFKDLEKGTKKSNKALAALGKKLAATFSVVAITAYAKKSIQAFLQEEKAIRRLSLALDNAGEGVNKFRAEEFVSSLQRTTRVADDQLRPALISLTNAGIGFEQSQELLALALDVSAGSGQDLQTVTKALTRAFNGNNTSLSRLGIGLTKAQLKVATFDDLTTILSNKFSGQASAAAGTYAGRLEGIRIASDEASESIGKALVTAIDAATNSARGAESAFDAFGKITSEVILGVGQLAADLRNLDLAAYAENAEAAFKALVKNGLNPFASTLDFLRGRGGKLSLEESLKLSNTNVLPDIKELERAVARSAKITQLNAKLAAQETKKATTAQKKSEADKQRSAELERLRKSIQYKFDIDAINIAAALRRNISKEDRDRLNELQALKLSDYQEDEDAIKTLQAVEKGRFEAIQKSVDELSKLNPDIEFKDNLDEILAKLKKLLEGDYSVEVKIKIPDFTVPGGIGALPERPALPITPKGEGIPRLPRGPGFGVIPPGVGPEFFEKPGMIDPGFKLVPPTIIDPGGTGYTIDPSDAMPPSARGGRGGDVNVNINIEGSLLAQNDLTAAVAEAVYTVQRIGDPLILEAV
jgi:hypothetical protein